MFVTCVYVCLCMYGCVILILDTHIPLYVRTHTLHTHTHTRTQTHTTQHTQHNTTHTHTHTHTTTTTTAQRQRKRKILYVLLVEANCVQMLYEFGIHVDISEFVCYVSALVNLAKIRSCNFEVLMTV